MHRARAPYRATRSHHVSNLVDRPRTPIGKNVALQDTDRFASGAVLRHVAADEFSDEVHHLVRLDAALRFPLLCLGITASSPLSKDTLSFHPGLVASQT